MNEVENSTTFPDQITDSNEVLDSASTNEFMVLLKRSPETARLFFSFMTNKRAKRLYVQARHKQKIAPLNTTTKRYEGYWGTHIYVDGKRKAELLRLIAQVEKVNLAQTIAVGDGANDLPMISQAGLGIAFHAKPRVVANAKQSINTIGLDGVLYFLGFKDSYIDS